MQQNTINGLQQHVFNSLLLTLNSTLHFLFVDVFYIPSYLRGGESSEGTFLEPWRGVDRPGDSQGVGMNVCLVSELAKENACPVASPVSRH